MSFLPRITPTTPPTFTTAPTLEVAGAATAQFDATVNIPAGVTALKITGLWFNTEEEPLVSAVFNPGGGANERTAQIRAISEAGTIRAARIFVDSPPVAGAQTLRFTTANAVIQGAAVAVERDARTGDPVPGEDDFIAIEADTQIGMTIRPVDAKSISYDLVISDSHGVADLTIADDNGQIFIDEAVVNTSFVAAISQRTHRNNSQALMGWTAATAASNLLQLACNIPHATGQVVPVEASLILAWSMDEEGTIFEDELGNSNLAVSIGAASPGAPSLIDGDAGNSVSLGGNTLLRASSSSAHQVGTFDIRGWSQKRSSPASGQNRLILFKDAGRPPGGISVEQYNDGGTDRLRAYGRDESTDNNAIWIGSQTGQGVLTNDVGFSWRFTFDGTWARLFLDDVEIASSNDPGLRGLQDNTAAWEIGGRNVSEAVVAGFDGLQDRIEVWQGVSTEAQAAAQNAIDPGAGSAISMSNIPLGLLALNDTFDSDVTEHGTGFGDPVGTLSLTEVSDPNNRMSFPGGNGIIRITTPATAPAATQTNEQAAATVAEDAGDDSNQFTITWSLPGSGGVSEFPFVTDVTGSLNQHGGVAGRPGYNELNPLDAAIIDPATNIQLVRLTGNFGTNVLLDGVTSSGFVFPHFLRPDNSGTPGRVWNADGSMLYFDQSRSSSGDPSNSARALLIDMDGSRTGAVGRIIRAGSNLSFGQGHSVWWFWDPLNPARAYVIGSSGQVSEWWPVGEQGHAVDEVNQLYGSIAGFTNFRNGRAHLIHCSWDGQFFVHPCRRASDGIPGGIQRNLLTGDIGPFCPTRHNTPYTVDNATAQGTSATGRYSKYTQGNEQYVVDVTTNTFMWRTNQIGLPTNNFSHSDWTMINGREYLVAPVGGQGIYMVDILTGQPTRISSFSTGNPNHMSCRNYADLAETYGQVGNVTSGQRYGFLIRSNGGSTRGIRAFRMDPNGPLNVGRAIANHRCERTGDSYSNANESEAHCQPSPDGSKIAFPSNWRVPGVVSDYDIHGYCALIPADAWHNPNNDGSA